MRRTSPPSSKRSPQRASGRDSLVSQPPRDTLQVRDSWIETDGKGPPPLRGAAADRDTLQVRPSWVETDEPERVSDAAAEPAQTTRGGIEGPARQSSPEQIARAKSRPTPEPRAKPKKQSRNMRPSLDPSWEMPAPDSEPSRRALPPPLPVATPIETAPPSRRKKTR